MVRRPGRGINPTTIVRVTNDAAACFLPDSGRMVLLPIARIGKLVWPLMQGLRWLEAPLSGLAQPDALVRSLPRFPHGIGPR
jgi:hypothetical protein